MSAAHIRPASKSDRAAIVATVRAAFTTAGHDARDEVDIVQAVWSLGAAVEGCDLVAVRDEEVVGHVLGSWGDLAGHRTAGIAPLAVAPAHQGSGVGTALMTEIIRRGTLAGLPLCVILGDPGYYNRFGFEAAAPFGAWYGPAGHENPHFMVRRLAASSEVPSGEYRYAWER